MAAGDEAGRPDPSSSAPVLEDATFVATMFGGPLDLTVEDAAGELGVPVDELLRLWRVMGFPSPPAGEPVFVRSDLVMFEVALAARSLLGPEAFEQFVRVLSSSLARVADAAMSVARTNVTGPLAAGGASADEVAAAGEEAAEALRGVDAVLGPLFQHHTLIARRRSQVRHEGLPIEAYDRARQLVGFADLESSTALHGRTSPTVLARAIAEFEAVTADEVLQAGGRVVKHIGDEVMFTTDDVAAGCRAALAMASAVHAHPVLTRLRVALAFGEVVPQDGDVYGATVNLAARLTDLAAPGQVLATVATRDAADAAGDLRFTSMGTQVLRDVGEAELFEVTLR